MRLRNLSNLEFEAAEAHLKKIGRSINRCPTCPDGQRDEGEWTNGTYRFHGEYQGCDCALQSKLWLNYFTANIPEEYMRLEWERDYSGDKSVTDAINNYLTNWATAKTMGFGLEFGGEVLGVGKTFAATHIAKELVKRGEPVTFISFQDLLNAYLKQDQEMMESVKTAPTLILDEVTAPWIGEKSFLVSVNFEQAMRERSAWNRVTIMTTNLSEEAIANIYPRVYSILSAKQVRVPMTGQDARQNQIAKQNMELLMNGEVRPIT